MTQSRKQRRVDETVDFELVDTLMADAIEAVVEAVISESQVKLRGAFRSVFAAVEGTTHYLKGEALRGADGLEPEELALLREEGYGLSSRGDVTTVRRRLPAAFNFLFAVHMASRSVVPEVGDMDRDEGWAALQRAIAVRHRLTHPRKIDDLVVSRDETLSLLEAMRWCMTVHGRYEEAVLDLMTEGQRHVAVAQSQLAELVAAWREKRNSREGTITPP